MEKPPSNELSLLQYETPENFNDDDDEITPEKELEQSRKQYFNIKLTLSVILVIMATTSVQSQMQSFAPFVRNVQNFFNYHLLTHESQDIYEGGDVIYYRTQEYIMAHDIMAFFENYVETMQKYHNDSFFYHFTEPEIVKNKKEEMVKILIISEVDQKYEQTQTERKNKSELANFEGLRREMKIRDRIMLTVHEQEWVLQRPLSQIGEFFNLTVLNKEFYKMKVKRIELEVKLPIKFKTKRNCSVDVKTVCVFHSGMMMAVKVETSVIDEEKEDLLQSQQKQHEENEYSEENLGIRKLSEYHNMSFVFENIGYFIFGVNCLLFCVELMVIIRTNFKIERTLNEEKEFQRYIENFTFINKKKNSPHSHPNHLVEEHSHQSLNPISEEDEQEPEQQKKLTYWERLEMIGLYNVIELTLSFLVLITVNNKGLVCMWCWTKMSIYLSDTGNRMMIGFLFKKAIPFYLKIIFNLSIWLSGFVFFSMVTYRVSKKFETVQLTYYEYLFNYFQYGIFENFRPISRYGWQYSFLYFIQMSFLVMIGNNILMSILAQQVLKSSNMEALIEFIEQIEVECPVCGSPPEVKKKIKLKPGNERDQQFISQYFQSKKESEITSKYDIRILSPQLSPMFHKSQLKEKSFKLRKVSRNNVSIVGEESLLESPPVSPISRSSPIRGPTPLSPLTSRRQEEQKKKVKIEIGGEVVEKKVSKIEEYSKIIKTKSEIINKILQELSHEPVLSHNPVNKNLILQFLKKKVEEIKSITSKME